MSKGKCFLMARYAFVGGLFAIVILFGVFRWNERALSSPVDSTINSHRDTPRLETSVLPTTPPQRSDADWSSFALLVVDIQKDFCNGNIISQNPLFEKNVIELLAFARASGIEVIHIRSEFDSTMKDWPSSFKLMFSGGIPCTRDTDGAQPAEFARELANERVFIKSNFDGFSNQELKAHLRSAGKKHLLVAGLTTDVCILSTVFGAVNDGYVVSVVNDCCSASDALVHQSIMSRYSGFIFDAINHREIAFRHPRWMANLGMIYPPNVQ